MEEKKKRLYRLHDYIRRVRIMAEGIARIRMPPELMRRYADCIDQAERILWPADPAAQPGAAAFFGYLIEQCEKARHYSYPEAQERLRDIAVLATSEHVARLASELSRELKQNQRAYGLAVGAAAHNARVRMLAVRGSRLEQGKPTNQRIALADLLGEFAKAIHQGVLVAQAGPWEYRTRYGPIMFPEPREGKKATVPDAATCLSVFLSCLVRNFVANRSCAWGKGDAINLAGDEFWPVIEEAVFGALGARPDPKVVRQFARRNPGATIYGYD